MHILNGMFILFSQLPSPMMSSPTTHKLHVLNIVAASNYSYVHNKNVKVLCDHYL